MAVNFQLMLDGTLRGIESSGVRPKLLLHSCCGPCSSAVLETLSKHFDITILYYNPNIWPESEFDKRADAQRKLTEGMKTPHPVTLLVSDYRAEEFDRTAAGLENEPEGGKRCLRCFALRLEETVCLAARNGFDYVATTLSVSPHKDAAALNDIGGALAREYGVAWLYADFKKRGGYGRSIELSRQYGLYRQDYCGCRYSMEERRKSPNRP